MRRVYLVDDMMTDHRAILDRIAALTPTDDVIVIDSMQAPAAYPRIDQACFTRADLVMECPQASRVDRRGNARQLRYTELHGMLLRGFYDACARATVRLGKATQWAKAMDVPMGSTR